ncbi:MAG: NADH-quinone oxidoreductase subunit NuoF [Candidatus Sericytochromatia bacterium]|nr:NADH-quinone oxidoreductase subunit NuoF [Candidatus Sericytochromatia bacterium]
MAPKVKILSNYFGIDQAWTYDFYTGHGGYETAKKVLVEKQPDEVTAEVKASGLRGRGGAGFPAGMKWSFLAKPEGVPRYLTVNADESEPGTFKDRAILEWDPHMLIEGILIASYALGVHQAFVYIRGEFHLPEVHLSQAVEEAYAKGVIGEKCLGTDYKLDIVVHRGAGAYICGEETALLESLEGKRGYPRLKPPFPAVSGLFGCPTIINNVETIANVPWILANGGAAYAALGTEKSPGTRLFSISGHVNKPGVYEEELGIPLMTLINENGGGVRGGKKLKAVIPGGSSTPVLTPTECETITMDYEALAAAGTMFGSAGIIVMDEDTSMVEVIVNLLHFYAHESCGQCSPCREGTGWLHRTMKQLLKGQGTADDVEKILDIANQMEGRTVCPLAAAATMPTRSYLTKFRSEFEALLPKLAGV